MPPALLASQFETLEQLTPDERGLTVDVDQSVDAIIDELVEALSRGSDLDAEED